MDWNILSQNLSVDFIQGNFANYVDYWDWSVITQRVDAVFLHLHFKEYISFWNQGIAIEKITPLLSYDDIVDSELERVWDWDLISARVEDSVLIKILAEKMDFLDWDIVSSRICNIADNDFATLIDNNPVVSEHLDWDHINENMALSEILKYRDLHNASWDWSIITRRFDTDFVIDNLSKYASYWDWNVILNEKIQQTYVKENLDHVRDAIAVLEDNIKNSCWTTISRLYSPVELLEISEARDLSDAEQKRPKGKVQVRKISESVELLHFRTSFDCRYLELESNDCLKSRMQENCTYGSVRGSRQAFHLK